MINAQALTHSLALRSFIWTALVLALLFGSASAIATSASESEGECKGNSLCILIPRFNGPEQLGASVATVLNLQLLQTLERVSDGRWLNEAGVIIWSDEALSRPRYAEAISRRFDCRRQEQNHSPLAKPIQSCDMIFWGSVYPLNDEAIALSYLSLMSDNAPVWKVNIGETGFLTELPALNYSFKPFALSAKTVSTYSKIDALRLNDGRPLGTAFKVERWLLRDTAEIRLRGNSASNKWILGQLKLPALENRSDAVDFTAGVIRAYRDDWSGTIEMMQKVTDNPTTEAQLRAHALWYQAWAFTQLGESESAVQVLRSSLSKNPATKIREALVLAEVDAFLNDTNAADIKPLNRAITAYCESPAASKDWISNLSELIVKQNADHSPISACAAASNR